MNIRTIDEKLRFSVFFKIPMVSWLLFLTNVTPLEARPEYSAFSGNNCMVCHSGPIGGFGRKPLNMDNPGYINDKFYMSGDLQFMALSDQRQGTKDRIVFFPMQGALHFGLNLLPTMTVVSSLDFGILREIYGMIHNVTQTLYARAGFFTLPYGILFPDHTSFIKEGRVESGARAFEEKGLGAGIFSVRYKDSGVEVGYQGRPWFVNLAITSGVIGQEDRAFPSSQGGTKKAFTRRAGLITQYASLGVSQYNNDNEVLDRRINRYGVFGWVRVGPVALMAEHDEGEDEAFTVSGSTQIAATYAELVYGFPFPGTQWSSYLKARYERLDPNKSIDNDIMQRFVYSLRTSPEEYLSIEAAFRQEKEEPTELSNDDVYIITHFFF